MRAVSTWARGTRATLSVVATTTGQSAPMKIKIRAGFSPIPNSTIANGSQAYSGTARSALVNGSSSSATTRDSPSPRPSSNPTATARTQLSRQRPTLAAM